MLSFIKNIFSPDKQVVFKYQGSDDALYPSAEVEFLLDSGKEPYKAFMIIDSGADISVVPKSIGEAIGLKKSRINYLGGIGGRIGYYINNVNVLIAGKKLKIPVAWITNDESPLLLGRKGVFDKFKICFNENKGSVTFISI